MPTTARRTHTDTITVAHRAKRAATTALAAALLAVLFPPAPAHAEQTIKLSAAFAPERLGHDSSLSLAFQIAAPAGAVPSPVTEIGFRYPRNLGITSTGLGIEHCTVTTLELVGPTGCPADSVMGVGSATGEIAFGPEIIREGAAITIVRAANEDGHIAMLFNAFATSPVQANIVIPGLLLPGPAPFGGHIQLNVPLVESLPEAPDVAAVQIQVTIGPAAGLRYTERVRGRTVHYTPRGILLPDRCPHGGFPFEAAFTFQDGSTANAETRVPCPRTARRRRAGPLTGSTGHAAASSARMPAAAATPV